MRKIKIDRNFRGNGDCNVARGNQAYGLLFDTNKEAFELTNRIYKHLSARFNVKPNVFLTGRQTKNLMGTASYRIGRIRLHNAGANVGCLIHELGHLFKDTRIGSAHSNVFKSCQTEIYHFWNTIKHEYFENATKGGLSPEDQLNAARGRTGSSVIKSYSFPTNSVTVRSFRYGERVSFVTSKRGHRTITGTVLRINRKSVSVREDGRPSAEYWRVSPGKLTRLEKVEDGGDRVIAIVEPTPEPKPEPKKPIAAREDVVDTPDEIKELIEFAIDKLSKYAVYGSLSMAGIVRTFHARGIMNNDDNRAYAIEYVNELGLRIR